MRKQQRGARTPNLPFARCQWPDEPRTSPRARRRRWSSTVRAEGGRIKLTSERRDAMWGQLRCLIDLELPSAEPTLGAAVDGVTSPMHVRSFVRLLISPLPAAPMRVARSRCSRLANQALVLRQRPAR